LLPDIQEVRLEFRQIDSQLTQILLEGGVGFECRLPPLGLYQPVRGRRLGVKLLGVLGRFGKLAPRSVEVRAQGSPTVEKRGAMLGRIRVGKGENGGVDLLLRLGEPCLKAGCVL